MSRGDEGVTEPGGSLLWQPCNGGDEVGHLQEEGNLSCSCVTALGSQEGLWTPTGIDGTEGTEMWLRWQKQVSSHSDQMILLLCDLKQVTQQPEAVAPPLAQGVGRHHFCLSSYLQA